MQRLRGHKIVPGLSRALTRLLGAVVKLSEKARRRLLVGERDSDDVEPAGEPVEGVLADLVARDPEGLSVGVVAVWWCERGRDGG